MTEFAGPAALLEHECWSLLRTTDVGRLAVVVGSWPDIFPINFVVDHGTIVFRTAEGTKLSASTTSLAVAFEADGFDVEARTAWSVVVKGWAQRISVAQEQIESMRLPLFPMQDGPKRHFVRIEPAVVSGRNFHVVEHSTWTTPVMTAHKSTVD
jgi:nitroimidazol reductase NimA-like FMN-containing flavoprotein (pyridoxamine 5'-phosphate oxidase superfamily)